jgi:peroxiredoxin
MIAFVLAALVATSVPEVTLANLERRFAAGSDTVFVVNFWATWCKPCVAELPAFDQLARTSASYTRPIKVLLVSLDSKNDHTTKLEPFVRRRGISCDVARLNERSPHVWIDKVDPTWQGSIPATWIVSRSQRVLYEREFTQQELHDTLTQFLKSSPR